MSINTKRKIVLDLPDPAPRDPSGPVNEYRYKVLNCLRQIIQQLGLAQHDLIEIDGGSPTIRTASVNTVQQQVPLSAVAGTSYCGAYCNETDTPMICWANSTGYIFLAYRQGGRWFPVGNNGITAAATPATPGILRFAVHGGHNPCGIVYVPASVGGTGGGKFWIFNQSDDYVNLIDPVALTASSVQIPGAHTAYRDYCVPIFDAPRSQVINATLASSKLVAIDAAAMTVNAVGTYTGRIIQMCMDVNQARLWTTMYDSDDVFEWDPATLTTVATPGIGFTGAGVAAFASGPGAIASVDALGALWVADNSGTRHCLIDANSYAVIWSNVAYNGGVVTSGIYASAVVVGNRIIPGANGHRYEIDPHTGYMLLDTSLNAYGASTIIYNPDFDEFYMFDNASGGFQVLY